MKGTNGAMYGIAVRNDIGLWLLARVRRSRSGDVYFLIQTAETTRDVHASYHESGERHLRSYGWKHFATQLQRPDASFRGVETIFALALPPGQASSPVPCVAEEFDQVFEIPESDLPADEDHALVVDLTGKGGEPSLGPWREIVVRYRITDRVPWIVITVWRGLDIVRGSAEAAR